MFWGVIIPIIILVIITGCGIAICYFFVSRFKRIRAKILISFLLFGLLIGIWSFRVGQTDFVFSVNLPGSYVSEIVYNKYLIPYWQRTLEPVGYNEIPIIELPPVAPSEPPGPSKKVGVYVMPKYDFPLSKVSDLYIPASAVSWGLIGLITQLIYNGVKRLAGSRRGTKPLLKTNSPSPLNE